ncbi:hypothetical protein [Mucilaginibacter sp.]|jgi:hypothetical protein|uniref:hypothetical protein n=1 Tax=Mucilaginibacter sp. TaxID=1882438 RepID=UPI0035672871
MANHHNLSDFVTLRKGRNFRADAKCSPSQEAYIYQWLKEGGFGISTIGSKTVMFKRNNDKIEPTSVIVMKHHFQDFLETAQFNDWPEGVGRHDLLEWYYRMSPLKQNGLFRHYLKDTLTEDEIHQYKMADDVHYRHTYEMNQMLTKLNIWGFKKTEDIKGTINTGCPLYYKNVKGNLYLVFSHYESQSKQSKSGFDCWLAPFKNEQQIGMVKFEGLRKDDLKGISYSFNLERDYPLIQEYISN